MPWDAPDKAAFLSVSRKAMKGEFEVLFPRRDFPQGTEAALDALDEVERIEKILSVFRFDSRVAYINHTASETPVRVDEELYDLIEQCHDMAQRSSGAVDITSGLLWDVWGFSRREGRVPSDAQLQEAIEYVDYRFIELDPLARTVFLKKKGVRLNFGCVGKGFALDIAARRLRAHGVSRFLFHGGLSSVLAEGDSWTIGVAHPMRPGKRLAEISLSHQKAVGTSGSQNQFFIHRGKRYSHLIDPRTGTPAQGVLSVTVLAQTATQAELISTAFFIEGLEFATRFCEEQPDVSALFVLPSEKRSRFEIQVVGIPDNRLRFLQDEIFVYCSQGRW